VEGCSFELCLYSVGQPKRTFPLCPYCFNNPSPKWGKTPGEDIQNLGIDSDDEAKERNVRRLGGRSITLECPHPDKHPIIDELMVSPDPSGGVLVLDPHFGPKWRLVGTREPTIVHLPRSIDKLSVLDERDVVTNCHLMRIQFKTDETPLKEGKTTHKSCFPNDEILQGMVRVHHGQERTQTTGRGRRGGHGGRRSRGGRGGRGRSSR